MRQYQHCWFSSLQYSEYQSCDLAQYSVPFFNKEYQHCWFSSIHCDIFKKEYQNCWFSSIQSSIFNKVYQNCWNCWFSSIQCSIFNLECKQCWFSIIQCDIFNKEYQNCRFSSVQWSIFLKRLQEENLHFFLLWKTLTTPDRQLLRESTKADQKWLKIAFLIANCHFRLPICDLKHCFNTYRSVLLNSRDSSWLLPIRCDYHENTWTNMD